MSTNKILNINNFINKQLDIDKLTYDLFIRQQIQTDYNYPRLVIVSYLPRKKTIPLLKMCIDSIIKFTDTPYELWVVDNNSPIKNLKWLLDYDNVNLIFNRTNPKETGSYANGIGLEIVARIIDKKSEYMMTLHQDTAVCKKGWLQYMLSKFDAETRAVGVRKQDFLADEDILHVLGYIIDFQLLKKINLSFMPELPKYDVGDKVISELQKAGYKIFSTPNTFIDKSLVEKIPDNSFFKNLNVDRSFDDDGDIFFLHLGRGVAKSTGKNSVRTSSERSVSIWVNTLIDNLFPEKKRIEVAKKKVFRNNAYSVRRFYVDRFFLENISVFNDDDKILDMGGKKSNKRGYFNIENYHLNVLYANLDESTEPNFACDIKNIPVDDNLFDGVILSEVLEHVKNPKEVLKEAYRILKPGGKALITTPFMFPIHADPYDYGRYTDTWFKENLSEIGFKEIQISHQGSYYAVMANNYKLMANEYNKRPSILNYILKYWYEYLSVRYFKRELKLNKLNGHFDFYRKFTTGFGVVCHK